MRISDWSSDGVLFRSIAELSAMYGQGHPDMQNAKAQLSQVQTRISEELSRASIGLQAEAAARRSREAQLAGEMGSLKARALQQGVENVALMDRSEEHTSELQSLMRSSYAVFCLKKKKNRNTEKSI